MKYFIVTLAIFALFEKAWGSGILLEPIGRSSRWRSNETAPKNYNDMNIFCGGYDNQYIANGGKCGICGDNYADPTPRDNELGGKYGDGAIVKTYRNIDNIVISFNLTKNRLGYVSTELCNLDASGDKEFEDCFKYRLKFADGKDKFYVKEEEGKFEATVILPQGINCKHCVLRWTYHSDNTGNSCGEALEDNMGCGKQETYKSCADISITQHYEPEFSEEYSEEEIYVPV